MPVFVLTVYKIHSSGCRLRCVCQRSYYFGSGALYCEIVPEKVFVMCKFVISLFEICVNPYDGSTDMEDSISLNLSIRCARVCFNRVAL